MMLYDRHTPPSMHLHYEDHYLRTTNSHRARTYVRTHTRTVAVTANLNGVTATFCATLNIRISPLTPFSTDDHQSPPQVRFS
jgi:hypothetical protein